jgi:hypothetical protein
MGLAMGTTLEWFRGRLARYLAAPVHIHGKEPPTRPDRLLAILRPADALLVEGSSRAAPQSNI